MKITGQQIGEASRILDQSGAVSFAYLYGSALSSDHPRDVDVALYLTPETMNAFTGGRSVYLDLLAPFEEKLKKVFLIEPDVQLLRDAPLSFRFSILSTGRVIADRDPMARVEFEYRTRTEYFDFAPRRKEYFEALAS